MNTNTKRTIILYPAIPSSYPNYINPNPNLDELSYLTDIVDSTQAALMESAKHTPFITIAKLTAPIEEAIPQLDDLTQDTPPSSNLIIGLGLNASRPDGRYHTTHGWSIINNPDCQLSDSLATSLTTAAIEILGSKASSGKTQSPSQRYLNQTPILNNRGMPSVLTLNLYLDNRRDTSYLLSSDGRQAIIDLHVKGILNYLEST